MTHLEIRHLFKKFFCENHHTWLKSWPLVAPQDPSLLFVNAGMNQFKNIFLNIESPTDQNVATIQKCLRAGGKHNDLEQVGPSHYHHTFFEMMGNFSFGGYFKKEACVLAWNFLTKEIGIPKENLGVSVLKTDKETGDIWKKNMGLPSERIFLFDRQDNFWSMGGGGPCGPCSEIYFDPQAFKTGSKNMVEVWNLVFMEYQENENKKQIPLPQKCIDTGMGLERLASILQSSSSSFQFSNYNTDLFLPLLQKAAHSTDQKEYSPLSPMEELKQSEEDQNKRMSLRVLVDHIRASSFLIADGVGLSNEGRGYILKRLIRRAIYHGSLLTQKQIFISSIAQDVIRNFSSIYPELKTHQKNILEALQLEEEKFFSTLEEGKIRLIKEIDKIKKQNIKTLSGHLVFTLYDTFGFPADLTSLMSQKEGIQVDMEGFNKILQESKLKSRRSSQFSIKKKQYPSLGSSIPATEFVGYKSLQSTSKVVALFDQNHKKQKSIEAPGQAMVLFDRTPFYPEGGGQVSDQGRLLLQKSNKEIGKILDCQEIQKRLFHTISIQEKKIKTGEIYQLQVLKDRRQNTAIHHSATHLLHAALRNILGKTTHQAGSLVAPDRLRFDFNYPQSLSEEQILEIENQVNEQIFKSLPVQISYQSHDQATREGALSFFEKTSQDSVRVLSMGNFSKELCGGTHVQNTREIYYFKIISESSVGSGIRRIEAICGKEALNYISYLAQENLKARKMFHLPLDRVKESSLIQILEFQKKQIQKLKKLKQNTFSKPLPKDLETFQVDSQKGYFHTQVFPQSSLQDLVAVLDQMKQKFSNAFLVLCGPFKDGQSAMVAAVPKILSHQMTASEVIRGLKGKGGGPPSFAKGVIPESLNSKDLRKKVLKLTHDRGLLKEIT